MHGGHAELEGCWTVRRFAWQIGGVGVALAGVAVLGLLAFGCGSSAPVRPTATASPTPHPTATTDPRVAEVDAAVRRYVQAVEDSARTGSATAVDALVVAGSQAAGNAGIVANLSRENHYNFIASRIDYDASSWHVAVLDATANVTVRYSLYGHLADWPSLAPKEADHETPTAQLQLELALRDGRWLVDRSS